MTVTRELPCGNSNFLVDFGFGDSRSVARGFAEVIFPQFIAGSAGWVQDASPAPMNIENSNTAPDNHIILKRGVTGNLDLYKWWDKACRGKAPQRRAMKIELLGEDRSTVVLTWRFRNVRPVSLSYSPLRAIEGGIVMETVVMAFESMAMY